MRDAHLLWGGEEGEPFSSKISTGYFLSASACFGWCTRENMSGLGQSLLPSLLNHVTASFSYYNVHICKVVSNNSGY